MAILMLPKQINPIQLADNNVTLSGELSFTEMERLRQILCDDANNAK